MMFQFTFSCSYRAMCIKVGITVFVYVGEGYILDAHAARSYNFIPLLSLSFVCLYIAPIVQHRTLTLIRIGRVTIDFSNHKWSTALS